MNPNGKEEAVELEAVNIVKLFLSYESEETVNYVIRILMFISIHLKGKN